MPTHLIESDARQFLCNNLQSCHATKMRYFSIGLNMTVMALLIFGFGYVLYSRYNGTYYCMSKYERIQKAAQDHAEIVARMKKYHHMRHGGGDRDGDGAAAAAAEEESLWPASSAVDSLPSYDPAARQSSL